MAQLTHFHCDVQDLCLELPSVHVCSPLTSSGRACKQMPPGMLCPEQLAHCARLCRKMVSGQLLCLLSHPCQLHGFASTQTMLTFLCIVNGLCTLQLLHSSGASEVGQDAEL